MPKSKASRPDSGLSMATTKTKDAPLPTVIQDEGAFEFPTGDKYEGSFEVKKKEKTVKMLGPGIYTSAQGDSYTGIWDNDQLLNDEVIIASYPDSSKYEGPIYNWKYSGEARYTYPDGTVLFCQFADNCPVEDLTLVDPNGHKWLGTAERGFAWFYPVNHYYEFLESKKDVKSKRRVRKVSTESKDD